MIISEKTIKALQEVINGDGALGIYRSGPVLVDFFNGFGRNDEYGRGFPSRSQYTAECLSSFNDSDELKDIIESVVDPRDYISPEDISSSETSEEMQLREIVDYLNKFLEYDGYRLKKDETRNRYEVIRLDGGIVPNENLDTLSDEFINDQIKKARGKLAQDDYDGAITNVRSLVEAFQEEIIRRSGAEVPKHDGDLLKLYRKTKQVLNLDPSEQPSDILKQILTGFNSIVSGLSGMSNKMGDRHSRTYKPSRHHAKLAINAAFTFCEFLHDSYKYQEGRKSRRKEG